MLRKSRELLFCFKLIPQTVVLIVILSVKLIRISVLILKLNNLCSH